MLFEVAGLLVGLAAELTLVRPVYANHLKILLQAQASALRRGQSCTTQDRKDKGN